MKRLLFVTILSISVAMAYGRGISGVTSDTKTASHPINMPIIFLKKRMPVQVRLMQPPQATNF